VASGELTRDGLNSEIRAKKQRRRGPRKARTKRVSAKLGRGETVSVSASVLDLNSFVQILEKLLHHAQQAQAEGLTLEAMIKRLASARLASPVQNTAA